MLLQVRSASRMRVSVSVLKDDLANGWPLSFSRFQCIKPLVSQNRPESLNRLASGEREDFECRISGQFWFPSECHATPLYFSQLVRCDLLGNECSCSDGFLITALCCQIEPKESVNL